MSAKNIHQCVFKGGRNGKGTLCGLLVNRHHPLSTPFHSLRYVHDYPRCPNCHSARELRQGALDQLVPPGARLHAHIYSAFGRFRVQGYKESDLCPLDHCVFLPRSVYPSSLPVSWGLTEPDHPVRVVSFGMRAALAKIGSAGENFDLVLAQQIIYSVGFFGILYSAYIMVLDRYDRLATPGFHNADRLSTIAITGNLSREPWVDRPCRGSPGTESSYASLWSLPFRSVLLARSRPTPAQPRIPSIWGNT